MDRMEGLNTTTNFQLNFELAMRLLTEKDIRITSLKVLLLRLIEFIKSDTGEVIALRWFFTQCNPRFNIVKEALDRFEIEEILDIINEASDSDHEDLPALDAVDVLNSASKTNADSDFECEDLEDRKSVV